MGRPGTPHHYSGTADSKLTKQALTRKLGQAIVIRNIDATNDLLLSLTPSGKVYYTIPKGQEFRLDCLFQAFWVAAGAGTAAWCAVTVEG